MAHLEGTGGDGGLPVLRVLLRAEALVVVALERCSCIRWRYSVAEVTEYRGRKRIGIGDVAMMHSLEGQGRTEELLEVGLAKVLALEGSVLAQSELAIAVGAPINLLAIFPRASTICASPEPPETTLIIAVETND